MALSPEGASRPTGSHVRCFLCRFGEGCQCQLKHDGETTVNLAAKGERLNVNFDAIAEVGATSSVASLNDTAGLVTFRTEGSTSPQRDQVGSEEA